MGSSASLTSRCCWLSHLGLKACPPGKCSGSRCRDMACTSAVDFFSLYVWPSPTHRRTCPAAVGACSDQMGVVFVDVLGHRLGPRGSADMSRDSIGPRQLRFLNETILASAGLMTLVVVAPCAPKMLPTSLVQPLMKWRNHPPVPAPKHFGRQLLFLGGGRRARKARVGMFVTPAIRQPQPEPPGGGAASVGLHSAAASLSPQEGGAAFMLSTGSVAGRPHEISFGIVYAHANLHSAWVERCLLYTSPSPRDRG